MDWVALGSFLLSLVLSPASLPPLPPDGLELEDAVVGDGLAAVEGDLVTVHYVVTTPEGRELASTQLRGLPFSFVLDERAPSYLRLAVLGMAEGGERLVRTSPSLAFGEEGLPPVVPPGASLVVRLRLLRVRPPRSAGPAP